MLRTLMIAVFLSIASVANAAVIVLDFEGLDNFEPVEDFYNGGTGGFGSGPGSDHNITFGETSLAVVDADAGGTGNFANEPSADTILFFLTGSAILNALDGFDTGFSFFYTSVSFNGSVTVYDGLNATGNVLATLPLIANGSSCGGDPTGQFNCWTPVGVLFDGVAMSVDFSGVADQIGFDDVTFGTDRPGGEIPEPASMLLLGAGLATAAARRRFKRNP
jgi:hypothetical protein